MAAVLDMRMLLSSLDGECRDYGEREIGQGQAPQTEPIVPDFPDVGAQLVDANQAINREIRGENPTQRDGRVGDGLARPCEAGGEKLGQAGCEKKQGRVLRPREKRADGLTHKAGRKQKDRSEGEELWNMPEGRKAVETRQPDQIDRYRRKVD